MNIIVNKIQLAEKRILVGKQNVSNKERKRKEMKQKEKIHWRILIHEGFSN